MNVIKRYYSSMMALGVILGVCGVCYYSYRPQSQLEPAVAVKTKKQATIITVFIHGSLYPDDSFLETVSLSDLNTIFFDTIDDDSEYIKSLKRVRANSDLYGDQIILAEGLQEIPSSHIAQLCDVIDSEVTPNKGGCHHCGSCHKAKHTHKAPISQDTYGAHYAIAGYSSLMHRLFPQCDTAYYTFGHLGVLSHRYRKSMAKVLYADLVKKIERAQEEYESVKLVVVAHSHGGNIALNLACAENEFKKGLVIDDLVLFGTPLQQETAPYACHLMFKRVMNCYSLGDAIQGSDVLTTASRKCHTTFASFNAATMQPDKVYDIQLKVNGDVHVINHGNMWHMQRNGKGACHLEPLPYAVMTPALIAALDAQKFGNSVCAMIRSVDGHLGIEVQDTQETTKQYASPNAYDVIARLRDRIPAQDDRVHA